MADPQDKQNPNVKQWQDQLTLGNKGINTFQSPLKIGVTYLADGENIEIEDGNISSRSGSINAFDDPTNEPTTAITQIITAYDSKGGQYFTRYWNGNFDVWDTINSKWINLNGSVSFTVPNAKFGYSNWNNGYGFAWQEGADVLYMGNGTDQMCKWVIARCTTTQALHHGDTTIHVDSAVQFPPLTDAWHLSSSTPVSAALTSQPILVAGTAITYTALTSTTFTISSWSGTTIPIGSVIYIPLQLVADVVTGAAIPGGSMMTVVNQQNYIAGIKGSETYVRWSDHITNTGGIPHSDPEYFNVGVNFIEMADGDGGITALFNSMDNVIVMKPNSIRKLSFQEDSTLDASLASLAPVFDGSSAGSQNNNATLVVNQMAYYPTSTEGISSLTPSYTTSGTVTYQPSIVSIPIQNYATDASWNNSSVAYFNNKIVWSIAEEGSTINNAVIYYDILAQGFGKERGWYVNSWAIFENQLYFANQGGMDIRQAFSDNFDDQGQAYESYALTCEFPFGEVAKNKLNDKVYVQGTINKAGILYVEIDYNGQNGIWKQTYKIEGSNPNISFSSDNLLSTNPLSEVPFIGTLGNNLGFFKFYLKNENQWAWNTIQLKFYSNVVGSEWEIQAVSLCPVVVESLNSDLDLDPQ